MVTIRLLGTTEYQGHMLIGSHVVDILLQESDLFFFGIVGCIQGLKSLGEAKRAISKACGKSLAKFYKI